MIDIHPEYLVDNQNQKKAVLLPFSEWAQLLDELEELDDIRAYDQAKTNPSEAIPFEDCVRKMQSGEKT
jgi:PHD/YefM family antitoxin component YafN of YafNO toxin-antitoxin module